MTEFESNPQQEPTLKKNSFIPGISTKTDDWQFPTTMADSPFVRKEKNIFCWRVYPAGNIPALEPERKKLNRGRKRRRERNTWGVFPKKFFSYAERIGRQIPNWPIASSFTCVLLLNDSRRESRGQKRIWNGMFWRERMYSFC